MSETTENEIKKTPEIKSYYKYELCFLYGIGPKTFNKWLEPFEKKIGPQVGKKFTPQQVRIIFECLDPPS